MNLREWGSNSKQFIEFVAERDRAPGVVYKVLGILWNCKDDTIAVPICSDTKQKRASTKREVASIFDPLGYFTPTVLMAKLFVQELWREKWGWDTSLDEEKTQRSEKTF